MALRSESCTKWVTCIWIVKWNVSSFVFKCVSSDGTISNVYCMYQLPQVIQWIVSSFFLKKIPLKKINTFPVRCTGNTFYNPQLQGNHWRHCKIAMAPLIVIHEHEWSCSLSFDKLFIPWSCFTPVHWQTGWLNEELLTWKENTSVSQTVKGLWALWN